MKRKVYKSYFYNNSLTCPSTLAGYLFSWDFGNETSIDSDLIDPVSIEDLQTKAGQWLREILKSLIDESPT